MPSLVTSTTSIIPQTQTTSSPPKTTPPPPPSTHPQDIIDLSVNGTPDSGQNPNTGFKNYGPSSVKEQFRFDIENGRFGSRGRYTPLDTRFESVAQSTYQSRAELAGRVDAFSGQNSAQAALFALGYQDASPNATHASRFTEARTQQNRRIDRNLDLLHML